jgi:hypothetical protein
MSLLSELEKVTPAGREHPLMQKILDRMSEEDRAEMEEIRVMPDVSNWRLTQVLKGRGFKVSEGAVANWRRGLR